MFYTQEIIADIFKFAGESVTLINRDANFAAYIERTATGHTEQMWKDTIKRNVDHLEIIKGYKHDNGSSIWTTEDFTAIDAAIVKGKTFYGG
tara:strand:+ start:850 stop:1125 length:276 start_codon:yes stop_codon:yes gene_type:complete